MELAIVLHFTKPRLRLDAAPTEHTISQGNFQELFGSPIAHNSNIVGGYFRCVSCNRKNIDWLRLVLWVSLPRSQSKAFHSDAPGTHWHPAFYRRWRINRYSVTDRQCPNCRLSAISFS